MENQRLEFTRHSKTDIYIGSELFTTVASKFNIAGLPKSCTIITNETLEPLYLKPLEKALQEKNIKFNSIVIHDGETYKVFDTVNEIIKQLSENEAERDCPIIGLGGGVVCDITGFVASIYKRGVPLILIPTTLLAMVDASFGGKNAINTESAKNLIGSFYQPLMTFIDVSLLNSLSLSQIYYGLVEPLKHGLIYDMAYFNFIIKNLEDIKAKKLPVLQRVIRRSVYIKKEFIIDDELDTNKRAHLNFGHTFGHALETAGEYMRYNHAEAVGLGMLMAIKASVNVGLLKEDFSKDLKDILTSLELPTELPVTIDVDKIIEAIKEDKKRSSHDGIKFILLENPGKSVIYKVKPQDLDEFVRNSLV
jgi:3-dehydroquinate synthase